MSSFSSKDMRLSIDGGMLEGGGQMIRSSIAMSAILKIPSSISKIRNSRPKPGLAAQHAAGIEYISNKNYSLSNISFMCLK